MTKLQELLEKVEAGDCKNDGSMFRVFGDEWMQCFDAYNGSLDAAKSLHEAVLPDFRTVYVYQSDTKWCWQIENSEIIRGYGESSNPARSWLIAILKALIAMEEAK
jgi:hypothetical protein